MKAGQLEIEILANVASLQADMEKIKKSVGDTADHVGRKARAANDNLSKFGRTTGRVGNNSRLASHHVQNLSFQLQDIFIGLQGGQKPMTVFLQQGSQIGGIMQQAGLGVAGFAKQIAIMSTKFLPLIIAAGGAAFALNEYKKAIEDQAGTDEFVKSLGLTTEELEKLGETGVTIGDVLLGTWDVIAGGLWDVIGPAVTGTKDSFTDWFWESDKRGRESANSLIGTFVGAFNGIKKTWSLLPSVLGDVFFTTVNGAIQSINSLIRAAVDGVNSFIAETNKITSKAGLEFGMLDAPQVAEIENSYVGAAKKATEAFRKEMETARAIDFVGNLAGAVVDASVERRNARLLADAEKLIDDRSKKSGGSKKKKIDELAKAYAKAVKEAESFIAALETETSRIGKSAVEIKRMTVATAAAKAPTDQLRQAILKAGEAWEMAFAAQADTDFQRNIIQPLRDELELLGLIGPEREIAALAMEEAAFKTELLGRGVTGVNEKWEEYLRLRKDIIEGESALDREADAAARLADELDRLIGVFSGLGGVGSAVGSLLGLASGQIDSIGGPLGSLLNMTTGGTKVDSAGREVARTLGDEMREIFKLDGEFGKTMTNILQGAGTGLLAGSVFGLDSTGNQIGGAIGGALGQAAGDALGKTVGGVFGKALGPLGGIVGGLAGSLLGGLFSSTPRGSATIGDLGGALGVTGSRGNSSARIAAATDSANAIISGLESLAAELGGSIDASRGSVSVGVRNGNFRVDTSGQGITKTKKGAVDFGEDAEAAALFAMQDLIRDGVLVGLRKGTESLLRNATDIETGISKALAFEGVFKELQELQDPLGAALGSLESQFDGLRKIFAEAGATAEEYGQLEELLTIKRQDALDAARQRFIDDQRDRIDLEVDILRLLGREQEALNLARETELAGLESTLKPLQQMVFQLQDARAIIDQFGPLADSLRAFKDELSVTRGTNTFGALRSQFQSTSALARDGDAAALGRLQQVSSAYLDAARENSASALDYQRAVGEVMGAVDDGIFAADSQAEFAQMQIDAINANSDIIMGLRTEMKVTQEQIVAQGEWVERQFRRWDGDGLRVRSDQDTPVYTSEVT